MTVTNIYAITNADGDYLDKYDVNKELEDAGVPADVIAKGEAAIESYASEHHIDLDALQPEVKKPEHKEVSGGDKHNKKDFETKLEELGIPKDVIEEGKEAVKAYAQKHNIQLPAHSKHGSKLNFVS